MKTIRIIPCSDQPYVAEGFAESLEPGFDSGTTDTLRSTWLSNREEKTYETVRQANATDEQFRENHEYDILDKMDDYPEDAA